MTVRKSPPRLRFRAGLTLGFIFSLVASFGRGQTVEAPPPAAPPGAPAMAVQPDLTDVTAFLAKFSAEGGPAMVPIAPGEFAMGDTGNDKPPHQVTISRPFFLGATELTQAQWRSVMGNNPSYFTGDTLPVEQVSWDDAVAFCKKLTERERSAGRLPAGWEFALPTEAQWEYACRAGTTGDFPGDLDAMGWDAKNSDLKSHPVGQKKANPWGLFDMNGNVWEWCQDWFGPYPSGSVTDPIGPATGAAHVMRGGSFGDEATYCRSSFRGDVMAGFRGSGLGFRLALSSGPESDRGQK